MLDTGAETGVRFAPLQGYRVDSVAFRRLRLQQTLTLDELALRSGSSWRTLRRMERGLTIPRLSTIKAIATALNCDPLDLIVIEEGDDERAG